MEVENSQRLNRALKTKMIPPMEIYKRGDRVFYKKEGTNEMWDGPANVIGISRNGKTAYLAHGRFTLSASQSRLIKIPEDIVKQIGPVKTENILDSDTESDEDDEPRGAGPVQAPLPALQPVNHPPPLSPAPHIPPRVNPTRAINSSTIHNHSNV